MNKRRREQRGNIDSLHEEREKQYRKVEEWGDTEKGRNTKIEKNNDGIHGRKEVENEGSKREEEWGKTNTRKEKIREAKKIGKEK